MSNLAPDQMTARPLPFLTRQEKDMAQVIAERLAGLIVPELDTRFETLHGQLVGQLEGVQAAPQDVAKGWQELVYGSPPNAGADYVYTVHTASLWPLSVMCRVTCSNAVGERRPVLEYRDQNGSRYMTAGADVGLAASQSQSFSWVPNAGPGAWPVDDVAMLELPQQVLKRGYQLAVRLAGGDVADQIDTVKIAGLFAVAEGD
jgi:hypothetical protein